MNSAILRVQMLIQKGARKIVKFTLLSFLYLLSFVNETKFSESPTELYVLAKKFRKARKQYCEIENWRKKTKGSKLGGPCPKVRLSQDRMPIEPVARRISWVIPAQRLG